MKTVEDMKKKGQFDKKELAKLGINVKNDDENSENEYRMTGEDDLASHL